MAPSAPISSLPPPMPSPAFGVNDGVAQQSNGHSLGSTKLPGKSNLKHSPSIPSTSTSHSHSGNGSSGPESRGFGDFEEADDNHHGDHEESNNRGPCKVQWIDNFGKDLTQVFEFEPRYEVCFGSEWKSPSCLFIYQF